MIRWRKKDEIKLSNLIKKFNARIRYYTKKGVDYVLPKKITKKELKARIFNRKDFNIEVGYLEKALEKYAFSKDGKVTKWEKETLKDRIQRDNERKKRERKKETGKVYYNGELIGTKIIDETEFKPRSTDLDKKSVSEIRKLSEVYYRRSSNYRNEMNNILKNNYIESLELFKKQPLYNDIIMAINSMSGESFSELYKNDYLPEIVSNYFESRMAKNYQQILSALNIEYNEVENEDEQYE